MRSENSIADAASDVLEKARIQELPFAIRFWDSSELAPKSNTPVLKVFVKSPDALGHLLREPNQLGLGRAWVSGEIDIDGDLDEIFKLQRSFSGLGIGWRARFAALAHARRLGLLRGALHESVPESEARMNGRTHSLRRDSAAISYHYNVSNDFYRMVLGPSMVYSCAYFSSPGDSLEKAQEQKLDLICRKLALGPGERLLDIGCGWGSLVLHAASNYDVKTVGVTLSEEQTELGRVRIRDAGLSDRCEIRLIDYRNIDDGPYDKIASVGMYEHVGRDQLDQYISTVCSLLRPGGLFLNSGITRLHSEPGSPKSFIARYVFPDGELHPIDSFVTGLREADLELRDVESLREHYALTLRHWVDNLANNREAAIRAAGEDRERIWRLYMTGSAAAFERGDISVFQTLAAMPGEQPRLPLDRLDLIGGSARGQKSEAEQPGH